MKFHAWSLNGLVCWCFAFLILAIVVGNDGLSATGAILAFSGLILSLLYVIFGRRRRLLLDEDFLIQKIGFSEKRWKWSEIGSIRLDYSSRFARPVVSFEFGGARAYVWGPWNCDGTTVYTALCFCRDRWGAKSSARRPS